MRLALKPSVPELVEGLRPPGIGDQHALGSLMYHAYVGTIDYEGETEEQAMAEIRKTYAGERGVFIPRCSRLIEREGRVLSATLITCWQDRPFIAFIMTHPDARNTGLARACISGAMQTLFAEGETELRLAVTLANAPAVALFVKLGFQLEDATPRAPSETLPGP
jgi:ribosomal protein S18 acetylase RimI-like enzyme